MIDPADLTPGEVVDLAEIIASQSRDDDGNPVPLEEALGIVERTDRFQISLPPREYLKMTKLLMLDQACGPLIPLSHTPDIVATVLREMSDDGVVFARRTRLRLMLVALVVLVVTCIIETIMLFSSLHH